MATLISSFLAIGVTILYFLLGVKIHRLWPNPFTIPIFVSTIAVIITLVIVDIPYDRYADFTSVITYLLGPATVSLAYPLYQHRKLFAQNVQLSPSSSVFLWGAACLCSFRIISVCGWGYQLNGIAPYLLKRLQPL
ncbi:LrgB family protein [Rossellomorea sp. AcN35-11]|nr:LrgB family protein [Rossellomorea sp. AcN35-11]